MPYIKQIIIAGKTIEIEKYYTSKYKSKNEKRQPKEKLTKEVQEKINNRRREKKLTRLLNTNFVHGDFHLTLTYKKENRPTTVDAVKLDAKLFLEKMRKEYRKTGKELKYVHVIEKGERSALHHHLVINKCDVSIISKCWKKGYVNIKPLDDTGNYKKLAAYLIKASTRYKGPDRVMKKAWNPSRNLKKPIVKQIIISKHDFFKDEVTIPKKYSDYYVDQESIYSGINEETGYKYFTYTLIKQNE